MREKLILAMAGMMILALLVPVVSAADYSDNPQFLAHYSPEKISMKPSPDGGTTYCNAEAVSRATRTTIDLNDEDWPQFMHDVTNRGYSKCNDVPSDNYTIHSTSDLGIDVIGAINPVVFKNNNSHKKILVMTGYAGFEEPYGTDHVNLTCLDWYNNQLSIDWNCTMPRTTISSGYYSNSWSSAATDGTYAYASSDNKTVCVRISDGKEMWNFTMYYDNCNGGPTVTDKYVFCSDWSGDYYCLYKNNGTMKWVFNNTDTEWYDMEYSQATPAFDDSEGDEGMLYVTGWDWGSNTSYTGYLYKVDVATGTENWSYGVGNHESFCGSPSFDDDYVFVTSSGTEAKLYQIDKTDPYSFADSEPIEYTDATPAIDERSQRVYTSEGCKAQGFTVDAAVRSFSYSSGGLSSFASGVRYGIGGWTNSVTIAKSDVYPGYRTIFSGREDPSGEMGGSYNTTYAMYAEQNYLPIIWYHPEGGSTAAIAWDEVFTVDHEGDLIIFS